MERLPSMAVAHPVASMNLSSKSNHRDERICSLLMPESSSLMMLMPIQTDGMVLW